MPSFQLFLSMSASKLISTPIRDLNLWPLAIPVQCSINWANEPTGSWSLLVYKWSINECEYMKIIYIWLRNEYESHIRSDGHRNKSFFWSLAKTGKKSNASMSRGSWAIELNTRREIPYLRALFILIDLLIPSKVFGLYGSTLHWKCLRDSRSLPTTTRRAHRL